MRPLHICSCSRRRPSAPIFVLGVGDPLRAKRVSIRYVMVDSILLEVFTPTLVCRLRFPKFARADTAADTPDAVPPKDPLSRRPQLSRSTRLLPLWQVWDRPGENQQSRTFLLSTSSFSFSDLSWKTGSNRFFCLTQTCFCPSPCLQTVRRTVAKRSVQKVGGSTHGPPQLPLRHNEWLP